MKKSKFWIWFIPLFIITSFGIYNLLVIGKNINSSSEDSAKVISNIKEDYEKLNEEYINVSLASNNSYYKATVDEIKQVLNSDGVVFFGDVKDNVSRKIIAILNEAISSTNIEKIYYFDINYVDEEFKNYLKDKLKTDVIAGTLITINSGEIINIYYPNFINDDKELTLENKDKLLKEYQKLLENLAGICDESC